MLLNPVGNESYAYVLSLVEINLAYHNAAKNLIDSNPVESIFTPNIVGPSSVSNHPLISSSGAVIAFILK